MANRPAYTIDGGKVVPKYFSFQWYSGFADSQVKKCIKSFHDAIGAKTLEVSSRSEEEIGRKCSAFNLELDGNKLEMFFRAQRCLNLEVLIWTC